MTKRISIILALFFIFVASSDAAILYEDMDNLHVDTVIVDGNLRGLSAQRATFTLTNTGDKRLTGAIRLADKAIVEGNNTKYYYGEDVDIDIMPGETKTFSGLFFIYSKLEGVAHCCLILADEEHADEVLGDFKYELYSMPVTVQRNKRPNSIFTTSISGSDLESVDMSETDPEIYYQRVTKEKLIINWEYENLEEFNNYDTMTFRLFKLCWKNGQLVFDLSEECEERAVMEGIQSGEVKGGTVEFSTKLGNGEYYYIRPVFTNYYLSQYLIPGTATLAGHGLFVHSETSTNITDISADAESLPVYTIGGVRVADAQNLPKGIYVRGGKKFVVK